ncbi:zinc-finger-containing protein, partial [Blautia wexlerae]
MKQKQIRCPYCGSIAILRDASYVYGNKAKDGKLYVCSHFPQCNS